MGGFTIFLVNRIDPCGGGSAGWGAAGRSGINRCRPACWPIRSHRRAIRWLPRRSRRLPRRAAKGFRGFYRLSRSERGGIFIGFGRLLWQRWRYSRPLLRAGWILSQRRSFWSITLLFLTRRQFRGKRRARRIRTRHITSVLQRSTQSTRRASPYRHADFSHPHQSSRFRRQCAAVLSFRPHSRWHELCRRSTPA